MRFLSANGFLPVCGCKITTIISHGKIFFINPKKKCNFAKSKTGLRVSLTMACGGGLWLILSMTGQGMPVALRVGTNIQLTTKQQ